MALHLAQNRERLLTKRCFSAAAGTGDFISLLRPGRDKISSQALLTDSIPSSCGEQPISACAQSDPVCSPCHGKRCRQKHGVTPSRAYGRRRYNTLDLASKVVCHGNSLFPLDSLRFPGRMDAELRARQFGSGPGNAKRHRHPSAVRMDVDIFLPRVGFSFCQTVLI